MHKLLFWVGHGHLAQRTMWQVAGVRPPGGSGVSLIHSPLHVCPKSTGVGLGPASNTDRWASMHLSLSSVTRHPNSTELTGRLSYNLQGVTAWRVLNGACSGGFRCDATVTLKVHDRTGFHPKHWAAPSQSSSSRMDTCQTPGRCSPALLCKPGQCPWAGRLHHRARWQSSEGASLAPQQALRQARVLTAHGQPPNGSEGSHGFQASPSISNPHFLPSNSHTLTNTHSPAC